MHCPLIVRQAVTLHTGFGFPIEALRRTQLQRYGIVNSGALMRKGENVKNIFMTSPLVDNANGRWH